MDVVGILPCDDRHADTEHHFADDPTKAQGKKRSRTASSSISSDKESDGKYDVHNARNGYDHCDRLADSDDFLLDDLKFHPNR